MLKSNTIEAALYPMVINLISEYGYELYNSQIWETLVKVKDINGVHNQNRTNEFQTEEYGILYKNTITQLLVDKFGAVRKRKV
jgi:hypothetical protein